MFADFAKLLFSRISLKKKVLKSRNIQYSVGEIIRGNREHAGNSRSFSIDEQNSKEEYLPLFELSHAFSISNNNANNETGRLSQNLQENDKRLSKYFLSKELFCQVFILTSLLPFV